MEKLKTDYTNGTPITAAIFNGIDEAINKLIDGEGGGSGKVITMKQSEWDAIAENSTKLAAFCAQYDGYILNVTEDYTDSAFVFGGTFPIMFS